ncbi:hypothetical protein LSH36_13g05048 [Paralvinella palmiformis]|uniref:Uncharacterized protein n=1 Tax=Paralvinella palmiformis TaxID=53620 RepID=A0AAD9KDV8_9ANNE|nr:hypothetical protein LSH36_13g05048 [Paralvinella palmiformis]
MAHGAEKMTKIHTADVDTQLFRINVNVVSVVQLCVKCRGVNYPMSLLFASNVITACQVSQQFHQLTLPILSPTPVYAKIREEGVASEITICGGRTRQRSVYVSETNEIDVMMLTSRDDTNPVYFVLKYDVVGCTDPVVPKGAWLKRSGDKAVIACNYTTQVWHIVCHGNEWFGKLENCTLVSGNPQSDGLASSKGDFPYGLMVAVITGLVLGVLIGVALLAMVIVCHKKKHRSARTAKEMAPRDEVMDHVQGTPFLRENKAGNVPDSLDSGYGYTHVCDVTIYQPYQQRQMTSFLKDCNVTTLPGGTEMCEQEHYERPTGRKSSFATSPRSPRIPPDFIADHKMTTAAHRFISPEEKVLSGSADH